MPISSPRVSPVMIERATEVAALEGLLRSAAGGQGRLAVVVGEAGAGKSRLVREIVPSAAALGFAFIAGGCGEHDRDYPFAPMVDAFRQFLRTPGVETDEVFGPAGDERRLALRDVLPEIGSRSGQESRVLPPEQEKRRRFEAFVAVLARLAAGRPVLLVLEDLHWADPTSLELLALLPRRLEAAPVLMLATGRNDASAVDWQRCLFGLRRSRQAVELTLEPLTVAGVAEILGELLSERPGPGIAEAVWARTGGNPFFVEELVATAPESGMSGWLRQSTEVPRTVGDAVERRLEGLDREVRQVADLAAVAGSAVGLETLVRASGLDAAVVLAAVGALTERQLLLEVREDDAAPGVDGPRFAFRHALTRDAIFERILEPRRRELHRAVGDAVEALAAAAPGVDGQLAIHFHAARDWARTLTYALGAAETAERAHATAEALAHHGRALAAAVAIGDPAASALYRRCGHGLRLLGAFEPAREHLEAALRLARAEGDRGLEADALDDLAALLSSRDYREAERLAREAVNVTEALDDERRQARALNRLGNVLTNRMRFVEGRALHEEAERRFVALGDRHGAADALDLTAMAWYLAGAVPAARSGFRRAAAEFAALGDLERAASSLTSSGLYLAVMDGPCATDAPASALREDAAEGVRLCRQIGWRAGEAYGLVALAAAELGEGELGKARSAAEAALDVVDEIDHPQWRVIANLVLGLLQVELLDVAGALARFRATLPVADEIGAAQWAERLRAWVLQCRVWLGDLEGLESDLRVLAPAALPGSIGQRRALLAGADLDRAGGRYEAAFSTVDGLLEGASGPRPAAVVLLRGEVLTELGRTDEADAALLEARRLAGAVGPRTLLWRIAAARSRLWRPHDRELAAGEARAAREALETLARTIGDPAERAVFLAQLGVRPWLGADGRRRTSVTSEVGGLTAREREVAVAVARGLANKEIARSLVVAEKTVEMHVGSCLGKLGFGSRAQLAAWAVGQGLVAPVEQPPRG